jgi:hypothetical protein
MDIIKIRTNNGIVNISVPKCGTIEEMRLRSKKIKIYERFLNKLNKTT